MNIEQLIRTGLFQHRGCYISLAPDTFNEGGGLLDDVDVMFASLKFTTWDYGKADQKQQTFLKIDVLPEGTQDIVEQYWKVADIVDWLPSADGETVNPQSDKAKASGGIWRGSNAAIFLSTLVKAGVPSIKLASEKISDLAGVKVHLARVKRETLLHDLGMKRDRKATDDRENLVLTVTKLISAPWDSATAQSPAVATKRQVAANIAAPAPAKRDPIPSTNGTFDDGALAMLVLQVLGEHGGTLKKLPLMQEVFKVSNAGAVPVDAKDPDGKPARQTVSQRVFADAFLESQPYWKYDGGTITLLS